MDGQSQNPEASPPRQAGWPSGYIGFVTLTELHHGTTKNWGIAKSWHQAQNQSALEQQGAAIGPLDTRRE